ncbi:hypothetical protein CJ030_MR0G008638 [Morella rubra]|uniref:Uncharacterized protein n=1 Tax=Morella rubra TaxID=262757 RepID=A0A6A1UIE2_9ROSI|nr:hypothetical protein CJ030_MR0G008638 [Morella rubra]
MSLITRKVSSFSAVLDELLGKAVEPVEGQEVVPYGSAFFLSRLRVGRIRVIGRLVEAGGSSWFGSRLRQSADCRGCARQLSCKYIPTRLLFISSSYGPAFLTWAFQRGPIQNSKIFQPLEETKPKQARSWEEEVYVDWKWLNFLDNGQIIRKDLLPAGRDGTFPLPVVSGPTICSVAARQGAPNINGIPDAMMSPTESSGADGTLPVFFVNRPIRSSLEAAMSPTSSLLADPKATQVPPPVPPISPPVIDESLTRTTPENLEAGEVPARVCPTSPVVDFVEFLLGNNVDYICAGCNTQRCRVPVSVFDSTEWGKIWVET